MSTTVVHSRREPYDVYIGRPSKWGNPFSIGHHGDRAEVIEKYRRYLDEQIRIGAITMDEIRELRGKTLGCWCSPLPCHGDVLAELADAR